MHEAALTESRVARARKLARVVHEAEAVDDKVGALPPIVAYSR